MSGGGIFSDVEDVLEDHPEHVHDYLDGEDGAENFLIGKIMAATGGQANPGEASDLIDEVIDAQSIEWPLEFTVYRRPADRTTVGERIANEVPPWALRETPDPDNFSDPTTYEFGFDVTVTEDGDVTIEVADP